MLRAWSRATSPPRVKSQCISSGCFFLLLLMWIKGNGAGKASEAGRGLRVLFPLLCWA